MAKKQICGENPTGYATYIGIRLTHEFSKFPKKLKQQSSKHDSESRIFTSPSSKSLFFGQTLSKNFLLSFNIRPLTTRTTQKALSNEENIEKKMEDLDQDKEKN